jgi:hypothetical protein
LLATFYHSRSQTLRDNTRLNTPELAVNHRTHTFYNSDDIGALTDKVDDADGEIGWLENGAVGESAKNVMDQ